MWRGDVGVQFVAATVAGAILGGFSALAPPYVLAMLLFSGAASMLIALPRRLLPALALWSMVLLPLGFMDVPRLLGRYFHPSVVIMAIWVARCSLHVVRQRRWSTLELVTLILVSAAPVGSFIVSENRAATLYWSTVMLVCIVAAPIVARHVPQGDIGTTRSAFIGAGSVLGTLAFFEFSTGVNPWLALYSSQVGGRDWSVFRAKASVGHPLVLSLIGSVCFMIALWAFVESKGRTRLAAAISATLSLSAVALSVSRSGLVAIAIGAAVIVIGRGSAIGRLPAQRPWGVLFAASAMGAVFLISQSPLLAERSLSSGGEGSLQYRYAVFDRGLEMLFDTLPLGSGFGTSVYLFTERYGAILENSLLQLLISGGVFAVPVILWVALHLRVGIRGSAVGAIAGMLAFTVSIGNYNGLEGNPALLIILGLCMSMAAASGPESKIEAQPRIVER